MTRRTTLGKFAPDLAAAIGEWGVTASDEKYEAAITQLHALASVAKASDTLLRPHADDVIPAKVWTRAKRALDRLRRASGGKP